MKITSIRFKDRPQKPVDTAVWWVDYVMRHEDTSFLRPLAISLTWYQRRQLDVWGFLAVTFFAVLYIWIKLFRKIISSLCGGKNREKIVVPQSKKKK